MEFGQVPSITGVDFSLPSIDVAFEPSAASDPATRRLTLGCPVWGVKEWVGSVYPAGTAAKDFLAQYARQFNGIELNTSFYRIPDEKTLDEWRRVTPPRFRFCPKIHQDISRDLRLGVGSPMLEAFCASALQLGDRLGAAFLQLPPGFGPSALRVLDRFLGSLPETLPVAVEFRHPDWFGPGRGQTLSKRAQEVLVHHGAGTVITDVAGRRDVSHAALTAPFVVVRCVLNHDERSDRLRLEAWARRIREFFLSGARDVHFFVHQPDNVVAPQGVNFLIDRIRELWPETLREEIFRELSPWNVEGQLTLFG